jgi:hypothetical protein
VFRDGISSIPDETVIPLWLGRHFLVCENRVYHDLWIRETGAGQQVAQLHDRYDDDDDDDDDAILNLKCCY